MTARLLTALQGPKVSHAYTEGGRPAMTLLVRILALTAICNHSGLAAAQSPTVSPLEIVAVSAAMDGRAMVREPDVTLAGPTLGMCIISNDGMGYSLWDGTSWTQLAYTQTGGDPSIAYDAGTNRLVSCYFRTGSAEHGVWLDWFDVGSGTFLGPQRIVDETVDKPWLVRGELQGTSQELYVTYLKAGSGFGSTGAYGRSTDGGANWVTGSAPGGKFCNHASVASPNGAPLYIAHVSGTGWSVSKGIDQPGGGVQFVTLADSNGAAIVITPATSSGSSTMGPLIPGPSSTKRVPYVAADPTNPDRVYVVFYDNASGGNDVDIFCTRLDRNPTSGAWTLVQQVRVNNDLPGSDDKDQFCPAAIVDDLGRVHVVFYDDRNYNQADTDPEATARFDAYYAYSTDGGTTFTNIRLARASDEAALDFSSTGVNGSMPGEYPGIAHWGETILVTLAGTSSESPSFNKSVILGTVITF